MNFDLAKLNRLRSMSLSEIIGRGRQEFVKLADRFLIAGAGEMSDKSLHHEFTTAARNGSGEGTAGRLRDRLRQGSGGFLPSLTERGGIVKKMDRGLSAEPRAIIACGAKTF